MGFSKNDCKLLKYKSELHDIAYKHGTDKTWVKWEDKSYLCYYEEIMKKNRDEKINFLEIGVRDGSSIKTWDEYFTNYNKIVGIDIIPSVPKFENKENINIIVGDSSCKNTYNKVKNLNVLFDYILDDGSHKYEEVIKNFDLFFDLVKPGGFYIIEDLDTIERMSRRSLMKIIIKIQNKNLKFKMYAETMVIFKD